MLVAIDTSTVFTGVACYDEAGLLGECVWHSGREHTTQLLPQLAMLMRHIGRVPAQIAAVGVALGPGSWSGLRVGLSAAKGLALANGLAVVGISTLDVLAYQHFRPDLRVVPIIRLGRDRFATALYALHEPGVRTSDAYNVTLDDLAARDESTLFCGDIDAEVQKVLQGTLGNRAQFLSSAHNLRRPAFLAELAWRRFKRGELDDLATLEPIYLGQPVKLRDA